ncbi:multicopper oxidase domain-containing protein [Phototrophicus methaneseepsis]|uniref:Multicopper oxidase domain-containing protein n=1 Tax=Phototrophicus methaneseepsis TaxID=2710758 RepID=A0A7S8EA20_9CHLR|nr:multicopper oxidase domain-containing protein [Phototrophicus methaneseepsis]
MISRFSVDTDLYVFHHCHNLAHEDIGLMRNYRVE